jgi:hypothetical protein
MCFFVTPDRSEAGELVEDDQLSKKFIEGPGVVFGLGASLTPLPDYLVILGAFRIEANRHRPTNPC